MAKVYGVASVPTIVWGLTGVVISASAFATNTFAAPVVADALPQRFQTTQTPTPQAAPALFTTGAVLIRRTQAALPPPDEDEKSQRVEAMLSELEHYKQTMLTPQQVATIAEQSVQNAAPQVRAIALQSLKDSQDYLRTLTREAVQESDPAMTQALANAARNVITKDDRVVFAIRKAVNEALAQPESLLNSAGPRTELGPDHDLVASISDTAINPSSLGVSAILGALEPAAGGASTSRTTPQLPLIKNPYASVSKARQRQDWMDLRQYRVAVHTDNLTLPEMLDSILKQAKPYTGPWQVRWKLTSDNQDLLKETFSLDAETTFEEFINYLAQYIMNDRGVKLGFALFDRERLIVISD